jgi:hypothetical protein
MRRMTQRVEHRRDEELTCAKTGVPLLSAHSDGQGDTGTIQAVAAALIGVPASTGMQQPADHTLVLVGDSDVVG